ncbi:MAG: DISARM system helicase DrmA [Deltaproteobacteria bacterium]|nr:DISARM system helicase DrmA [Deltaproteobacteria bacterium]
MKVLEPRNHIVEALSADLVGPYVPDKPDGPAAEEILKLPPSRWYLTGFLTPEEGRDPDDPEADESLGAGDDEDEEETGNDQTDTKRKNFLPASMGLSLLLPKEATEVEVTVSFTEYIPERQQEDGRSFQVWRRVWQPPRKERVELKPELLRNDGIGLKDTVGIRLIGELALAPVMQGLPEGAQALSLFLVNRRAAGYKGFRDEQYIFQVEMQIACSQGILPRPNRAWELSEEWDERVADLQFRDCNEYAVGHGVSVEVADCDGNRVTSVKTCWIPRQEVKRVTTRDETEVTVEMEELADLGSGERVRQKLARLPEAYGKWIDTQKEITLDSDQRREARDILVQKALLAKRRIARGIELLGEDEQIRQAFCLANRAMAMAARRRNPERYIENKVPQWRLFQLAFVLMNLEGVANGRHPDREAVELIFFPTGGGKTEAYLGLIAYTLVLRRLRGRERLDQGLGISVLLRYTLRLLTLDQLGRAATLICALEKLRRESPHILGEERFSVGLWVGQSATPNTMKSAAKKVTDFKNGTGSNPCPLIACPWCGEPLGASSLTVAPSRKDPRQILIGCTNDGCDFSCANHPDGVPALFVDEQVYRELPSFIIATVDKFAMLPFRGEIGALFGKVNARDGRSFFGPMDRAPSKAQKLPQGLSPPDLIVQDELHLISGPLGTMVGLYETAIESLACRKLDDDTVVRPKIVAATATVRRAAAQIQSLFGRDGSEVNVFPPPGVGDSDTYFAVVERDQPGRLYLGVAAQGRSMKAILLRVYCSLLAAAAKVYEEKGEPGQTADAYMTLVGYFNSLRELGGMRRLVEDEVRVRVSKAKERCPLNQLEAPHKWYKSRTIGLEPLELTSRERTESVSRSKARLNRPYSDVKERVDVLLASNMISVGVDIDRLGLMVVAGQPKTTAEYIQASSRVGRQAHWPGLVVTCLNQHKPRDRSHYEHFVAYHESFYRAVEATSLTPFSGPALDRGLAGTLVALTRYGDEQLTPPEGAMLMPTKRDVGECAVEQLVGRSKAHLSGKDRDAAEKLAGEIRQRSLNLLDAWTTLVDTSGDEPAQRDYSGFDTGGKSTRKLLRVPLQPIDPEQPLEAKFAAPTSMRDVENVTHIWIVGRRLGDKL